MGIRLIRTRRLGPGLRLQSSHNVTKLLGNLLAFAVVATICAVAGIAKLFEAYPVPAMVGTLALGASATVLAVRRSNRRVREQAARAADEQKRSVAFREELRDRSVERIKREMAQHLRSINSRTTARQTLVAIREAQAFMNVEASVCAEFAEAVPDATAIEERLRIRLRVAQVDEFLRKAREQRFAGSRAKEREFLVKALWDARESGTTDEDLAALNIRIDDVTPATLAAIDQRARDLGWRGPKGSGASSSS
jgi:hypothetical protein